MDIYLDSSIENIKDEIWVKYPNYEEIYEVSTFGRVRSIERKTSQNKKIKIRIKKQYLNNDGYPQLVICKEGVVKTVRAHKMVAIAFIENIDNMPVINHKNGIKTDNRVENLEWCSIRDNAIHAIKNNLFVAKKGRTGALNGRSKKVKQITLSGDVVAVFDSVRECERQTGISREGICAVCRKRKYYKTAGGYKWEYV